MGGIDVLKPVDWKKYPDLYDDLSYLLSNGLTRIDIGRLYVSFLVESCEKRGIRLRTAAHEKDRRRLKREFQEHTRQFFSQLHARVRFGDTIDSIIMNDDHMNDVIRSSFTHTGQYATIEDAIGVLWRNNSPYDRVARALLEGARTYMYKEKGGIDTPQTPALFKEYNRIYAALRLHKGSKGR